MTLTTALHADPSDLTDAQVDAARDLIGGAKLALRLGSYATHGRLTADCLLALRPYTAQVERLRQEVETRQGIVGAAKKAELARRREARAAAVTPLGHMYDRFTPVPRPPARRPLATGAR